MRPGIGCHVWWMMPERAVHVLHRVGDDADRDEVVDLLELDLLSPQLEEDAVEALDPALDLRDRDMRLVQLQANGPLELLDDALGDAALVFDPGLERGIGARVGRLEGQLLELVLDLAHAEPVGDRPVDVERLLSDPEAALLGEVIERPHVVQAVGELHHDDADVVDHGEEHLAEVLRLPLFARRERNRAELGHALDDVRHLGSEQLLDALDRRERVLDDVVQQAGSDGHDVESHVREDVGDLERMDEIRLTGMANLSLVLERREDIRLSQQFDICVRRAGPDLLDEVLEPNHRGGV